jgi:dGTPase
LLISTLVNDLLAETRTRLLAARPQGVDEVRASGAPLAGFSPDLQEKLAELKIFLLEHMYRHPRVLGSMEKAKAVLRSLFEELSGNPSLLPSDWAEACAGPGSAATLGVVRDYIAGMTDRFALAEYRRIFHTEIDL